VIGHEKVYWICQIGLRNICFLQGLPLDRIQTIVRSRNYHNFDEIAETALVDERAITTNKTGTRQNGASYPGVTSVGKWATRATNALLGRKERHG